MESPNPGRRKVLFSLAGAAGYVFSMTRGLAVQAESSGSERLGRRLEWFRNQKFGFMMHWGVYSQLGCIESWPLVWADRNWSNPSITTEQEMVAFRAKYGALNRTFNPTQFDPNAWATVAKRAGMKYVVFTTKHHDGFSMFDTQLTDYRITSPDVPFSRDRRANVAEEVFNAFRSEGFGIGAYFSKPDWHSPDYWRPDRFAMDRNPNYDIAADPERWARFVSFVHGQVKELVTGYGKVDILWLDGGWVRPPKQDIRMAEMVSMARSYQPDLIVVNRSDGEFEDYTTPEQEVPDKPLLEHPWESCLTMGKQWSYKPDDEYKSARQLIHLLVDIVAKGGNLLLNVGPRPDGTLPATAVSRLSEIGDWMAINSEAIYGTRPISPYRVGDVALTQRGRSTYVIYFAPEGVDALPATVSVPSFRPSSHAKVALLGSSAKVSWRLQGTDTMLEIAGTPGPRPCRHAFVYKLSS